MNQKPETRSMSRTRVTVSLPEAVVEAADRRADEESRSRSWVVAEAVAAYAGVPASLRAAPLSRAAAPRPSEADTLPYPSGLGAGRSAQLEADMALTPERRVLEAELTARLADLREGRGRRRFVMTFERYEDYLEWKDRAAAGFA